MLNPVLHPGYLTYATLEDWYQLSRFSSFTVQILLWLGFKGCHYNPDVILKLVA
jgi:hypothetical protein